MTLKIIRSQAQAIDFESRVSRYILALEEHRFSGNARPTEDALIEAAVMRVQHDIEAGKPDDFVPDFEIVDDPVPAKTLKERKNDLRAQSRTQESEESEALMPSGKMRLFQIDLQEAQMKPPEKRSKQDIKLIADGESLQIALRRIARDGAIREAAIDDLTDD